MTLNWAFKSHKGREGLSCPHPVGNNAGGASRLDPMPIVVEHQRSDRSSDAELVEMADLCADRPPGYDIGSFPRNGNPGCSSLRPVKATSSGAIRSASRAHRGTPSLLVGLALVDRTSRAESALKGIMADQYRRRWPSPTRTSFSAPACSPRRASGPLLVCRTSCRSPTTSLPGEERAWARRLSKRFGCESRLTTGPSSSRVTAESPAVSTSSHPRSRSPKASTSTSQLRCRQGRPLGDLRLGHGRGPGRRQARPLSYRPSIAWPLSFLGRPAGRPARPR